MLLTCPSCSVKYNVADGAIPPQGRTVRCAACGNSWHQGPEPGAVKAVSQTASASSKTRKSAKKEAVKHAPHEVARKKAHDQIKLGHRIAAAVPWAIAASLAIAGAVTAIYYRTDIVRAWPKAASLFAAIRMPANLYGVDIADVSITSGIDVKGPRIVVRGTLKSVSRTVEPIPYLKVALVDKKGYEKLSWMVDPGVTVLQPGSAHRFESIRSNPARGSLRVIVTFAEPPPLHPRPPPEPPTGNSGLMGAKPAEPPHVAEAKPAPMGEHGVDPHAPAPPPVTAR